MKIIYLLGGIGLLALLSGPGVAQELLSDPGTVRACICEQQAMASLTGQIQEQRRIYDERRQALQVLDNQVDAQRAQLSSGQSTDTEGFKRLLDQRDEAEARFDNDTVPHYSDTVGRYNAAVAAYNGQCAGRVFASGVEQSVRASNFSCPKP